MPIKSEVNTPIISTNTIIITNLESRHFDKETMAELKSRVESYGPVHYFAPIKSFYRVFVVYHSVMDAQRAKNVLHNTHFRDINIKVYYGQNTEINFDPATHYLNPPELEKNWLISPPSSPPIGWAQVREDIPNTCHLTDDLVQALLAMGQPIHQLPGPDGSKPTRFILLESEIDDFSLDGNNKSTSATTPPMIIDTGNLDINIKLEDLHMSPTTATANTITTLSPEFKSVTNTLAPTSPISSTLSSPKLLSTPSNNNNLKPNNNLKINTTALSKYNITLPASPASAGYIPSTPTVLAFTPINAGDQPFITIQDWGLESDNYTPTPLIRRTSIPRTMFPSGPNRHSPPVTPVH